MDILSQLYKGMVLKRPVTPGSIYLTNQVRRIALRNLGLTPSNIDEFRKSEIPNFERRLSRSFQEIASSNKIFNQICYLVSHTISTVDDMLVDIPHFRGVSVSSAEGRSLAHRDTWISCSSRQINWWMPIFSVPEERSLGFYLGLFDKPVINTSEVYSHSGAKQLGALGKNTEQPRVVANLEDAELSSIPVNAGEILLFSAAHLHQPMPDASGKTRFSIDFRTVSHDKEGQSFGAPNLDNDSDGDSSTDFELIDCRQIRHGAKSSVLLENQDPEVIWAPTGMEA